ncbi:hypothetical protein LTS18_012994 [Coniosporium uncinatum]|uniref:Uncharacterized protein n=1 Tax=Coniosporium uncinatum TaxID=93489 RepID=A0ACC3D8Z5_9PEZI|nr:hypothetical protein LTS18_012994 [Coniosporium uncinatum]
MQSLPPLLTSKLTGLSKRDLTLLNKKQRLLRATNVQASTKQPHLTQAIAATLVFAQHAAGTAVCVSAEGVLLTCAHCVAENEEALDSEGGRTKWLLFASGQVVRAECTAWDPKCDLALLTITATQAPTTHEAGSSSTHGSNHIVYPFVELAERSPAVKTPLVCIGHPGSEDLETSKAGVKTGYDVLHVSEGLFRGHAPDQDLHDNSDIGALMHDCWTYWGHSGAPLVERKTGRLVGLHSSWDDETGMRRGIAWETIGEFLNAYELGSGSCGVPQGARRHRVEGESESRPIDLT